MSQAELAREIGRRSPRSTIHTWFTHGIQSFSGLIFAISALDIEWADLACPSLVEGLYGYQESTTHYPAAGVWRAGIVRHHQGRMGVFVGAVLYLFEGMGQRFGTKRYVKLENITGRCSRQSPSEMGGQPAMRKAAELLEIFERWEESFVLCLFHSGFVVGKLMRHTKKELVNFLFGRGDPETNLEIARSCRTTRKERMRSSSKRFSSGPGSR